MATFLFSLSEILTIFVLFILSVVNRSIFKGMDAITSSIAHYSVSFLNIMSNSICLLSIVATYIISYLFYPHYSSNAYIWIISITIINALAVLIKMKYAKKALIELKQKQP